MNPVLIQFLVGLYFVGASLPGMLSQPISRPTLVQFIFGLLLVILAFLKVSLIG
jgi:hypothetical protein